MFFKEAQKEVLTVRDQQYNIVCCFGRTGPLHQRESSRQVRADDPERVAERKEFLVKG